jgi:predicted AlkP superfamily pyrophosphatase or phosphodiesterase
VVNQKLAEKPQLELSHEGRRSVCVFVLIDALGWKFLEGREFLSDLLPFRTPLRTVLGFSSGAIPTILTGQPPMRNGHWNLFFLDLKGSPFRWLKPLSILPEPLVNNRLVRKIMKELGRHLLGVGKTFECKVSPRLLPWFNFIERRNIYGPHGIERASSIFDELAEKGCPQRVYTYHDGPDAYLLKQAENDIESRAADFIFVYLSELDALLHDHWKDPRPAQERLSWYDGRLRRLFENAKRVDSQALFAVFSDHGMTRVENHADLTADVERCGFGMPHDYLAVYDSTMARFWFFRDEARRAIVGTLSKLECGRFLTDGEQEALGILFPDRRYGEAIFLLKPGWMIVRSDFNGRQWMPTGMHGYDPDDPYSDAVFLSNRRPPVPVETIADVYAVMHEAVEAHAP